MLIACDKLCMCNVMSKAPTENLNEEIHWQIQCVNQNGILQNVQENIVILSVCIKQQNFKICEVKNFGTERRNRKIPNYTSRLQHSSFNK